MNQEMRRSLRGLGDALIKSYFNEWLTEKKRIDKYLENAVLNSPILRSDRVQGGDHTTPQERLLQLKEENRGYRSLVRNIERMEAFLDGLNGDERAMVDLHYCQGLGFWEISFKLKKERGDVLKNFSSQTADVLQRLIFNRPEEWDLSIPLFCTSYGEHWNTRAWTRQLARYAKKAGLKRFSAYDLRHQHAIEYLRNGGNLATLQKEMGHTAISMTQKYLALSDDDIQTAHAQASPVSNLLPRRKRLTRL
jgi:hypothetical protein